MRRITLAVICMLALALSVGYAAATTTAAPPADTLKVDYFSNANTAGAPDGTLRITNPGTASVVVSGDSTSGSVNVCADIFVFDPNQELSECCSCLNTPDGLATLSVNTDLTSNPLTGVTLTTGLIKIVSAVPVGGVCPLPTRITPEAALRSWTTHIQNSNFAVTEGASQDATLSATELGRLQAECSAIRLDGSGSGICTCGTGE